MYAGDHNPPHFHLRDPNSRALVDIVTLEVIAGQVSRSDLEEARKRDAVIAREIQTAAATLGNPELTPEKQKGGKAASVVREPT